MPDLLLAEAEKMRVGNEQQALTNQLLRDAMGKGPLWTWAWLYVWQYVLMFFWFWTLIGVDQALHHLTGFGLSIFMAAN